MAFKIHKMSKEDIIKEGWSNAQYLYENQRTDIWNMHIYKYKSQKDRTIVELTDEEYKALFSSKIFVPPFNHKDYLVSDLGFVISMKSEKYLLLKPQKNFSSKKKGKNRNKVRNAKKDYDYYMLDKVKVYAHTLTNETFHEDPYADKDGTEVHHLNGNPHDNSAENVDRMTSGDHEEFERWTNFYTVIDLDKITEHKKMIIDEMDGSHWKELKDGDWLLQNLTWHDVKRLTGVTAKEFCELKNTPLDGFGKAVSIFKYKHYLIGKDFIRKGKKKTICDEILKRINEANNDDSIQAWIARDTW